MRSPVHQLAKNTCKMLTREKLYTPLKHYLHRAGKRGSRRSRKVWAGTELWMFHRRPLPRSNLHSESRKGRDQPSGWLKPHTQRSSRRADMRPAVPLCPCYSWGRKRQTFTMRRSSRRRRRRYT